MAAAETIELIGAEKAQRDFDQVMKRMLNHRTGMRRTIPLLQANESAIFASHGGKYVKTGALRASLTEPKGAGAVRRPARQSLNFGTSIYYARFQREHVGPKTDKGGMKRSGRNVVMDIPEPVQNACAEVVMRYIVGGEGAEWGVE